MLLEAIIGLEIHVQLKTKSKMFCGCSNDGENQLPNSTVCEVCLGHPGVLPVPNKLAIEWAVRAALALHCDINREQHFDRKHYFYPDLPKGYQISQFDAPIGEHGWLEIGHGNDHVKIGITRLHLEEDAAKNFHGADGKMLVDYNRGGTPLIEIVSEPDIRSPKDAKLFLKELRLIMRYLNVSDADMEKGHLRCDANVSLRLVGEKILSPKTEIKNLNSFKMVERALAYEIQRQTKLWDAGTPPAEQSTRGWDEAAGITKEQRTKEGSADYRYFPEPDIPPLTIVNGEGKGKREKGKDNEFFFNIEKIKRDIPELPAQKRERFMEEYGLKYSDAKLIVEDKSLASYFEQVISELRSWMMSLDEFEGVEDEIWRQHGTKLVKLVINWFINKLGALFAAKKIVWSERAITPENFAEFITLLYANKLNSASAQKILVKMFETGDDPSHIMEEGDFEQIDSSHELSIVVNNVISENSDEVMRYKAGKTVLLQFFVGQVMKKTKGKANPELASELIKNLLSQK